MVFSGWRRKMEQDLLEAQELTAQAETRAQTLQTKLEAELEEERHIRDELQKQIASLQEAYSTISDKAELEVEVLVKMYDEATAQLEASKKEAQVLLKRLEEAAKIERGMVEDQKKLIQQVSLASEKEKTLELVLQQKDNELSEMSAFAKAQDAESRKKLKELHAREEELHRRLMSLQEQESKEEALSIELTQAHANNQHLDANLQAVEQELEALLKEKSINGAGKGNSAGKGKGKGKGKAKGESPRPKVTSN